MKCTGLPSLRTGQGFTLVELLLALALMLLLASAVVFSFSTLLQGTQLEEGAGRVESLIRFARAQAANTGRKVQLVFDEDTDPTSWAAIMRVTWEPDPLGQPGYFEELTEVAWQVQGINDLIQVEDVKLLDANGANPAGIVEQSETEAEKAEQFSPITFYPDGGSDSAEIILSSRDPDDEHRMSVRLVGLSGTIRRQLINAESDQGGVDDQKPEAERGRSVK